MRACVKCDIFCYYINKCLSRGIITTNMAQILRAFRDPKLPENLFRVEVNILRALGLELVKEETFSYKVYSRCLLFFLVYSFTFGEMLEIYFQWGNLNAIVQVVNYLFTHVTGTLKVTILMYNREKFRKMLNMFHQKPFAPDLNRGGKMEEVCVRETVRTTEIQLAVYFFIVSGTLASGGVICLKSRLFDRKEEWQYPFVPITVINTKNSPLFEIASLYQYICVVLFAAIIATIYVLLSTIMAQLSAQFKILNVAFRNIRTRADLMHNNDPRTRSVGECMGYILSDYINHHLKVLRLAKDLEDSISMMVLIIMLMSTVLLCFLLYQCSVLPVGSVPFIQNFFYYWIIVCQMSMYCYWGDEVTLQAAEIASAAAEADWPGAPLTVSKALVMVIARSQKPVYMTIGKFFPLSMSVLMSFLKGSFSYFMVMRQTQAEEE